MKHTIIIATLLAISCNMSNDQILEFVVPEYNEMYLKDSLKYAPYDYYSQNNIIIHSSKNEYYYHDNWIKCGSDWKVTNPPIPIDFKKTPLKQYDNVNNLINQIKRKENSNKIVILASGSDTIRNKAYFELKQAIKSTKDLHIIATRKTTSDEDHAIDNNFVIEIVE